MLRLLAQSTTTQTNPLGFLIFLLPLGMLFFLMRSNKRRTQQQQMMQRAVEPGEEILTTSGMFGTVVEVDEDDDSITVEIAPGTRVRMVRGGIARRLNAEQWNEDDDEEESAADDSQGGGQIQE